MDKIKEKLLADLAKANKTRKLSMAIKFGFTTVEEFKDYLQSNIVIESQVCLPPKPTIHNVFLLDASGSMNGIKYNNGKSGIMSLVKSIKEDKATNNTITVIELTTKAPNRISKIHCYLTKDFSESSFVGASGGTPLYKALGEIIDRLLTDPSIKREDKILLNVTTDGDDTEGFGEYRTLPQTIKNIQENHNFTITFVGTKVDVDSIKDKLSLDDSNVLVHDNTGKGIEDAYFTTVSARVTYSSNVAEGKDVTLGFYKKLI